MDAFAVAVCKGLSLKKADMRSMVLVGLWFGVFQGLMPAAGYFFGSAFKQHITAFDHWICFALLALIGGNMIKESFSKNAQESDSSLAVKGMLVLAIATSIDALAAGVAFEFLDINIGAAVVLIGAVTFVLCAAGVKIGSVFGSKYKSRAELAGGIILVILGIKILVDHLTA